MSRKHWLSYAIVTLITWGIWGALIELPERAGFPATLGYSVWAATMIPCAVVALRAIGWRLQRDRRSLMLGCTVGFLGCGGQLILFETLRSGPAYLVFPIVSLYPMLTVVLSAVVLREKASRRVWRGIATALVALPLLSFQPAGNPTHPNSTWLPWAVLVFVMWGVQAYAMKFSTNSMLAESTFFYMAATSVAAVPVAVWMTDFSQPVNWGWNGPFLAAAVQILNSIGALFVLYALRYGKAIVVVPMTALAPVLTIALSLGIHQVLPHPVTAVGMLLASVSVYLMAAA